MGVLTSEVGYISATARRGDHESSYEHVVALEKKKHIQTWENCIMQTFIMFCTSSFIVVCDKMEMKLSMYVVGMGWKRNTWRVWLEKLKDKDCLDNIKMDIKLEEWLLELWSSG